MYRVLDEIRVKRETQDMQWGGAEHDDKHLTYDFLEFIDKQKHKCWNQIAHNNSELGYFNSRDKLLNIAALAVAAVESMDRKFHE